MKAFVISLCVFTLVLGVTVWNSVYIGKVTSELEAISNEISPSNKEALEEAEDYWERNEHIICIFVSHKDIDNVNIAFGVLEEKIKNDDGGGFYEYLALLKKYIEEIGNKERFHIDNII